MIDLSGLTFLSMLMHWLKSGTMPTPAAPSKSRWRLDDNCTVMLIELQTQDFLSNGVMHGLMGGRRMDAVADPGFC
jgi:hypothetical protein